ncbi:MAG: peptide deformylase [Magnetococcales bacterium]|nr:peptide deformylase [Magnetococcales bacterium]
MAVLDILTYPNERLREVSEEVDHFSDPELQLYIDDLIETMHAGPACVGVAAPQTGNPIRLLIMDCSLARKPPEGNHGQLVVFNPVIIKWSGMDVAREGCLSLPDYTGNVMRAVDVTVQFQDRHGEEQVVTMTDFEARVIQHEMDHLEGKLFTDRIVSRKADLFRRKVRSPKKRKPDPNSPAKNTDQQPSPS